MDKPNRLVKSYTLLVRSIYESSNSIFKYGEHDCFVFSFKCLKDMVGDKGVMTRSGLLGYKSEEEALSIIDDFGGVYKLANHVATLNGMKEILGEPQWGDLVLFEQNNEDTLGVIVNKQIFTSRMLVGVARFDDMSLIKNIWRYE